MAISKITTSGIATDTLTAADLAPNSVDSSELIDGAVDLSHMSVNSVDSDQYVDGSIDLAHMSVNSIDSNQYVDGSIDTAHLADDAVTGAKIENSPTIAANLTVAGTSTLTGKVTATGGIAETGGTLKENLLTNSGFDVWSNSGGLINSTTGVVPAVDDAGSLFINGDGDSMTGWTDNSGSGSNVGVSGGVFTFNGSAAYGLLTSQACAVSKGALYRIGYTISTSGNSGEELNIGTSSGGSQLASLSSTHGYVTTSTGTFTIMWESTYTGNVYLTWRTGYAALRVDNLMMHEVTPGCVGATGIGPDTHAQDSTLDTFRQSPHATYTKGGSYYSLKTVNGASDRSYYITYSVETNPVWLDSIAGRTLTFGIWAYTTTASHARIGNYDGSSYEYSAAYAPASTWTWLEITRTFPASPTYGRFFLHNNVNGATSYWSQPMLVFGSSIGSGNYTRPKGEIIYFEKKVQSAYLYNLQNQSDLSSGDIVWTLQEDSKGAIPKGAKAVLLLSNVSDSGSYASGVGDSWLTWRADGNQDWVYYNSVQGLVANKRNLVSGWQPLPTSGEPTWGIYATGSGSFDIIQMEYKGVQLN